MPIIKAKSISRKKTSSRSGKYKQAGSENNNAKLTKEDVIDIRNMRSNGLTLKEIAKTKNTSIGNVGNIINRRSWREI